MFVHVCVCVRVCVRVFACARAMFIRVQLHGVINFNAVVWQGWTGVALRQWECSCTVAP